MEEEQNERDEGKQEIFLSMKEETTRRFVAILCLTMISLGAALGCSFAYILLQHEISESLGLMEIRNNETISFLVDRLEVSASELQQCLDDPKRDVEIGELKGKLSMQRDFSTKYTELFKDYDALVDEIEVLEATHKTVLQEGKQLERSLDERNARVEELGNKVQELSSSVKDCRGDAAKNQILVQQRQSALSREE